MLLIPYFIIMQIPPFVIPKLNSWLKGETLFLKKDAYIVFVCGANKSNKKNDTARSNFLEYSQKYFTGISFFMAEEFFKLYENTNDLLTIEDSLAQYSDCVLLFLESESVFAELGAFAMDNTLVEKLLVVNDNNFINSTSFINQGPLKKISRKSIFKDPLYTNFETILEAIPKIKQKLQDNKPKRKTAYSTANVLDFSTNKSDKVELKARLFFLLDLIILLQPVTVQEIVQVLNESFAKHKYDLQDDLSLLTTLKYVSIIETEFNCKKIKYYIKKTNNILNFIVPFEHTNLRLKIVNYYRKYCKNKFQLLCELKNEPN